MKPLQLPNALVVSLVERVNTKGASAAHMEPADTSAEAVLHATPTVQTKERNQRVVGWDTTGTLKGQASVKLSANLIIQF